MDKHQLVTIAITAVISVTAKELLTWVFRRAKIIATTDTTKKKARQIFSKNNRRIVFDLLLLSAALWGLLGTVQSPSPITKWLIVRLVIFTLSPLAWFVVLLSHVLTAIFEYRDRSRQI